MSQTINLENLLRRRRISLERFLESEGLTTLLQLDAWILSKPEYEIPVHLLEALEEEIRMLPHVPAPPTPPTPISNSEDILEALEASSDSAPEEMPMADGGLEVANDVEPSAKPSRKKQKNQPVD
jgi:hypothetical protein